MKAGSQSGQATEQSEQPEQPVQPERPEQPSRNNRWPATATKDLVERAQTAQLGEKTLGEINTWRDKKR